MRYTYAFLLIALPAFATDRPQSTTATATQQQANNQTQSQSASSNQTQGNSQTSNHRAWAFANGAPIPGNCPAGFLPGKGLKRAHSQLFGASAWSAVCERDEEWWAELVKQSEHQRAMDTAAMEIEREKIKLETLRLQNCTECGVRK